MESALYGIYALAFVSEILIRQQRVRNTVRPHFPWSILYILVSYTESIITFT